MGVGWSTGTGLELDYGVLLSRVVCSPIMSDPCFVRGVTNDEYEDEFPSTFRDLIMIKLKFTGVAMRSRKTEGNSSS